MRVTLTEPVIQRLQETFKDFSRATVNEVLAVLIAERNTLKDCLHSGQNPVPTSVPVASAADLSDLSDFSGMLDD